MIEFGNCNNFQTYNLSVTTISKPTTRSEMINDDNDDFHEDKDDSEDEDNWDFLSSDTYVAVAPDEEDDDSIWIIKILENNCRSSEEEIDDYWVRILPHTGFLKGYFLEKVYDEKKYVLFKLSNKVNNSWSLESNSLID